MSMPQHRQGMLFALGAYIIWGIAPVYFKQLTQVPADEILSHRIIWSFFFMLLLLSLSRKWGVVRNACRRPRQLLLLAITAMLVACNWLIYIWAVNHNHMLEASLGYFINPLVSVLLGMLFLGERFRPTQWLAMMLAVCGVLVQLWTLGSLPVIALALAFSFGIYGLLRKKIAIDGQTGMLFETLWLLPAALVYLEWLADSPTSHLSQNPTSLNLLLMAAGIVTTVPLLLFTSAAMRLRLSTLGFFQYLAPTLTFLLAVLVYGETITPDRLVTFAFIWLALAVFTLDALYTQRRLRRANHSVTRDVT
ncbi:EamA family transporter RarD [Dickeya dadantii]|uniref:Predicted chloramphenical resistance permease n=1 Tax=Dickeya dadantii (strain 3937) TaxID=198628 RepID=E0SKM0_DICD3|nr:EamA family transporter RarD [Dickeya dadantii]ADN00423.1 predicted chloramphenical resistance permease [Dickeya dadantii 3937]NPE50781.1 EamA family transporter RarD [Dickeya dadantii]